MEASSDPVLLTLLGLRLASFAPVERVAMAAGLPVEQVAEHLERCHDKRWCAFHDGEVSGWSLLPAGRVEGRRRLAEELEATGTREQVLADYRQFLVLNRPLLQTCTAWQLREVDGERVINHHDDPDYDTEVVEELRAIDLEVQPICADLAATLPRFASYGPRLAAALARIDAGDTDWFTKPTIDSYHTAWFELHENLLATLGIDRSQEATA